MKKLVIIGGGFTGAYCARKLEQDFEVTLIDTKDYYEFTPGILRAIVEPQHLKKMQVLHTHYLYQTRIIRRSVTNVANEKVFLNKKVIPYNYLIIASGSTYHSPIKEKNIVIAARGKILHEYYEELCRANNVLIIGGGIVGVELAAEIATHYPEKNITIVHAHNEFMDRMPAMARNYAEQFLKKHHVTCIMNERIQQKDKHHFITDKGTKITADLAFVCTGIKPNSEFMEKTYLDDKHSIKVNSFLQLQDCKRIFVGGDVAGIPEEKTAQNAENHAKVIIRNIFHQERGEPLEAYHSEPRTMVISLGKYDGIITRKEFVFTGIIPGILKTLIEWKTMWRY